MSELMSRYILLTRMPSQRDTALRGRKALSVLKALNGPMLPRPMISAPRLTIDIWTTKSDALENPIIIDSYYLE